MSHDATEVTHGDASVSHRKLATVIEKIRKIRHGGRKFGIGGLSEGAAAPDRSRRTVLPAGSESERDRRVRPGSRHGAGNSLGPAKEIVGHLWVSRNLFKAATTRGAPGHMRLRQRRRARARPALCCGDAGSRSCDRARTMTVATPPMSASGASSPAGTWPSGDGCRSRE